MQILSLVVIPLFFVMMALYFQFWIKADDFKAIFVFFLWGVLFSILYNCIFSIVNTPFIDKVATSTVIIRCIFVDGLFFASLFTLSFFGVCKIYDIDSNNLWTKSFLICFGFVCGALMINHVLSFMQCQYIDNLLLYVPYLLCYVTICIVCGFSYHKIKESIEWYIKLIYVISGILINGLLIASYSYLLFLRTSWIYILCVVYVAAIVMFYFLDYNQYGE